jgi:hypothetical protein
LSGWVEPTGFIFQGVQERGVHVLSLPKRPAKELIAGTKNFCPGTRMARSYKKVALFPHQTNPFLFAVDFVARRRTICIFSVDAFSSLPPLEALADLCENFRRHQETCPRRDVWIASIFLY